MFIMLLHFFTLCSYGKKKIKLEISNRNDKLLDLFCMKKYIFGIFYFEKRSIKREEPTRKTYKVRILMYYLILTIFTIYKPLYTNQNFKRQRKHDLGCVREITVRSPRLKMKCWNSWIFFDGITEFLGIVFPISSPGGNLPYAFSILPLSSSLQIGRLGKQHGPCPESPSTTALLSFLPEHRMVMIQHFNLLCR